MGVSWPRKFGGRGLDPLSELVVSEELAAADALPYGTGRIALLVAGPTLLEFGSRQQMARFLPRILDGTESWCICVTEPGSGSRITAATTKAVPRGSGFVLNGRKIWSSEAHHADLGLVLARTNPSAAKSWLGLSYFIVNMRDPGVTVRPIRKMSGVADFCEVVFDNVQLPANRRVGPLNGGWRVAATVIALECLLSHQPARLLQDLGYLIRLARQARYLGASARQNHAVRQQLAGFSIEAEMIRRAAAEALAGRKDGYGSIASAVKIASGELNRRIHSAALELLGTGGLSERSGLSSGEEAWLHKYFDSCTQLIARGTAEIHKNLISRYALGLRGDT